MAPGQSLPAGSWAPPGRTSRKQGEDELRTGVRSGQPGTDPGQLAQPQKPGDGVLLWAPEQPVLADAGVPLRGARPRCTITGASDASIRDPVPNDFAALLEGAPVQAVFCNGTAAWKMYTKYVQPVTGLAAVRLPSTSPANAACPPQALAEIWGAALGPWIIKNK